MTLEWYLIRRFYWMVLVVTLIVVGLIFPIDMMEQTRRFGEQGIMHATSLALLNLPASIYQVLPLIVILATISMLLGLSRSSELVVIRSSGRSALSSLTAPIAASFVLGVLCLLILNPIVAATQTAYERTTESTRNVGSSILSLSDEGIWLRQSTDSGQTVIRASRSSLSGTVLFDVTFLEFNAQGSPVMRTDASRARLLDGTWELQNAKSWPIGTSRNPERDSQREPTLNLAATLTEDQIRDSFGEPSAIPIFELPGFINDLHRAGFSALQHRVWLAMEIANPAFLMSMFLIGAAFTLRPQRGGGTAISVLMAILLGFGVFFLRNFAQVMGENAQLPISLAAWAPPLVAIFCALALMLHKEDG